MRMWKAKGREQGRDSKGEGGKVGFAVGCWWKRVEKGGRLYHPFHLNIGNLFQTYVSLL